MSEINDLKAKCYDILAQIQQLQQLLAEKNQQIAELQAKAVEPVKK